MLDAYLRHGGPANLTQALRLAAHLGGARSPTRRRLPVPLLAFGAHAFAVPSREAGGARQRSSCSTARTCWPVTWPPSRRWPRRSGQRGMAVQAIYAASLKDPAAAAFVAERLREWRPAVVLNATAFSASHGDAGSPLDAAGAPVLQVVLGGARATHGRHRRAGCRRRTSRCMWCCRKSMGGC